MRRLLLLLVLVVPAGCLGPLEPPSPRDDDDSAADDDDTVPDDDDSAADDDDDVADDDDSIPLVETGGMHRLCAAAGTGSNGTYTVRSCTGPVETAPGVVANDTYTIRINKLNALVK